MILSGKVFPLIIKLIFNENFPFFDSRFEENSCQTLIFFPIELYYVNY